MPTLAQAQATFNKSGGLNSLGESKGGYDVMIKGSNQFISFEGGFAGLGVMEAMLAEYISQFLNTASKNLNASDSISTGELDKSLSFKIVPLGKGYRINFTALDYYKFVDKGVRGLGPKNKNNTSPYKFKFVNPSKSHVQAIKGWIKANNLTALVSDINRYGAKGRENKGLKMPLDNAAWVVARSIKRKGLKATNFWQDAFDETFADFGQKMSAALGQSITVNLQQMAKEIKSKQGTKIPGK